MEEGQTWQRRIASLSGHLTGALSNAFSTPESATAQACSSLSLHCVHLPRLHACHENAQAPALLQCIPTPICSCFTVSVCIKAMWAISCISLLPRFQAGMSREGEFAGMCSVQGIVVGAEVLRALRMGAAVVALESTIISHGMPFPQNLETARSVESVVREHGAVPATIAILDGVPHIGLTDEQLHSLASQ